MTLLANGRRNYGPRSQGTSVVPILTGATGLAFFDRLEVVAVSLAASVGELLARIGRRVEVVTRDGCTARSCVAFHETGEVVHCMERRARGHVSTDLAFVCKLLQTVLEGRTVTCMSFACKTAGVVKGLTFAMLGFDRICNCWRNFEVNYARTTIDCVCWNETGYYEPHILIVAFR